MTEKINYIFNQGYTNIFNPDIDLSNVIISQSSTIGADQSNNISDKNLTNTTKTDKGLGEYIDISFNTPQDVSSLESIIIYSDVINNNPKINKIRYETTDNILLELSELQVWNNNNNIITTNNISTSGTFTLVTEDLIPFISKFQRIWNGSSTSISTSHQFTYNGVLYLYWDKPLDSQTWMNNNGTNIPTSGVSINSRIFSPNKTTPFFGYNQYSRYMNLFDQNTRTYGSNNWSNWYETGIVFPYYIIWRMDGLKTANQLTLTCAWNFPNRMPKQFDIVSYTGTIPNFENTSLVTNLQAITWNTIASFNETNSYTSTNFSNDGYDSVETREFNFTSTSANYFAIKVYNHFDSDTQASITDINWRNIANVYTDASNITDNNFNTLYTSSQGVGEYIDVSLNNLNFNDLQAIILYNNTNSLDLSNQKLTKLTLFDDSNVPVVEINNSDSTDPSYNIVKYNGPSYDYNNPRLRNIRIETTEYSTLNINELQLWVNGSNIIEGYTFNPGVYETLVATTYVSIPGNYNNNLRNWPQSYFGDTMTSNPYTYNSNTGNASVHNGTYTLTYSSGLTSDSYYKLWYMFSGGTHLIFNDGLETSFNFVGGSPYTNDDGQGYYLYTGSNYITYYDDNNNATNVYGEWLAFSFPAFINFTKYHILNDHSTRAGTFIGVDSTGTNRLLGSFSDDWIAEWVGRPLSNNYYVNKWYLVITRQRVIRNELHFIEIFFDGSYQVSAETAIYNNTTTITSSDSSYNDINDASNNTNLYNIIDTSLNTYTQLEKGLGKYIDVSLNTPLDTSSVEAIVVYSNIINTDNPIIKKIRYETTKNVSLELSELQVWVNGNNINYISGYQSSNIYDLSYAFDSSFNTFASTNQGIGEYFDLSFSGFNYNDLQSIIVYNYTNDNSNITNTKLTLYDDSDIAVIQYNMENTNTNSTNIIKYKGPNNQSSVPTFDRIRFETIDYSYLNINELQVWVSNNNIGTSGTVTMSSTNSTDVSSNIIDQNLVSYARTQKGLGEYIDLQLDQSYDVSSLSAIVAYSDNLGNINPLISKIRLETTSNIALDISEVQIWYDNSNICTDSTLTSSSTDGNLNYITDGNINTRTITNSGVGEYIDISFNSFNYNDLQSIVIYNNIIDASQVKLIFYDDSNIQIIQHTNDFDQTTNILKYKGNSYDTIIPKIQNFRFVTTNSSFLNINEIQLYIDSSNILYEQTPTIIQSSTFSSDISSNINDNNFSTIGRTTRGLNEYIDISLNTHIDVSNLEGIVVYSSIQNDTNPTISKIRYETIDNVRLQIGEFQVWIDNSNIASQVGNTSSSIYNNQLITYLNDSNLNTYTSTNQGIGEYIDISLNNNFSYNDLQSIVTYIDPTINNLNYQNFTKLILYDESNVPVIELNNLVNPVDDNYSTFKYKGPSTLDNRNKLQRIRFETTNYSQFNINELQLWYDGSNVAQNGIVTQSSYVNSDISSNLIDANLTTFARTEKGLGEYMDISFNTTYDISRIDSLVVYSDPKNDYNPSISKVRLETTGSIKLEYSEIQLWTTTDSTNILTTNNITSSGPVTLVTDNLVPFVPLSETVWTYSAEKYISTNYQFTYNGTLYQYWSKNASSNTWRFNNGAAAISTSGIAINSRVFSPNHNAPYYGYNEYHHYMNLFDIRINDYDHYLHLTNFSNYLQHNVIFPIYIIWKTDGLKTASRVQLTTTNSPLYMPKQFDIVSYTGIIPNFEDTSLVTNLQAITWNTIASFNETSTYTYSTNPVIIETKSYDFIPTSANYFAIKMYSNFNDTNSIKMTDLNWQYVANVYTDAINITDANLNTSYTLSQGIGEYIDINLTNINLNDIRSIVTHKDNTLSDLSDQQMVKMVLYDDSNVPVIQYQNTHIYSDNIIWDNNNYLPSTITVIPNVNISSLDQIVIVSAWMQGVAVNNEVIAIYSLDSSIGSYLLAAYDGEYTKMCHVQFTLNNTIPSLQFVNARYKTGLYYNTSTELNDAWNTGINSSMQTNTQNGSYGIKDFIFKYTIESSVYKYNGPHHDNMISKLRNIRFQTTDYSTLNLNELQLWVDNSNIITTSTINISSTDSSYNNINDPSNNTNLYNIIDRNLSTYTQLEKGLNKYIDVSLNIPVNLNSIESIVAYSSIINNSNPVVSKIRYVTTASIQLELNEIQVWIGNNKITPNSYSSSSGNDLSNIYSNNINTPFNTNQGIGEYIELNLTNFNFNDLQSVIIYNNTASTSDLSNQSAMKLVLYDDSNVPFIEYQNTYLYSDNIIWDNNNYLPSTSTIIPNVNISSLDQITIVSAWMQGIAVNNEVIAIYPLDGSLGSYLLAAYDSEYTKMCHVQFTLNNTIPSLQFVNARYKTGLYYNTSTELNDAWNTGINSSMQTNTQNGGYGIKDFIFKYTIRPSYYKYNGPDGYNEEYIKTVQNIRIDTTDYIPLTIDEVQLWVGDNIINSIVTQSSTYSTDISANLVDSSLSTYTRTDTGLGEFVDLSFNTPIIAKDIESLVIYSSNTNYNPKINKIRFITNKNVCIELNKVEVWVDFNNILLDTSYLTNQGIGEYIDISLNLVNYNSIQNIIAYVGNSTVDLSNFTSTKLQLYDQSNIIYTETYNSSDYNYSIYKYHGPSNEIRQLSKIKIETTDTTSINLQELQLWVGEQNYLDAPSNSFILTGSTKSLTDIYSSVSLTLVGSPTFDTNGINLTGSQYITIPQSILGFGLNDFTISLWVMANDNYNTGYQHLLSLGYNNSNYILINIQNNSNRYIEINDGTTTTSTFTYPNDSISHNYIISRKQGIIRLFIDGIQKIEKSNSNNLPLQDYHIGYSLPHNGGFYLHGTVTRLDIWNGSGFFN